MVGATFHPVRPWVAAVETKDVGIVWNYETKEIIKRFSLQVCISYDAATYHQLNYIYGRLERNQGQTLNV